MRVIDSTDTSQWQAVLDRCTTYDFYHLAAYNGMEAKTSNYRAVLFVYEEDEALVALPLILRPLAAIDGLQEVFQGYYDATSVYGYPGPVTNQDWTNHAFFERFGNALHRYLNEIGVIAVFSRLHPLIKNEVGLCVGEVAPRGETISINLTLSNDDQFQLFRKSHRYEIRKARAENVVVVHDTAWKYFDDFSELYLDTMKRVNASTFYHFKQAYFDQLRVVLGDTLHLFVAIHNTKIISAALFTIVNGLVEYHLSGSSTEELNFAASKLIIDEVRLWATAQRASIFHLGGGVGAQMDGLYLFKSGFSPDRHTFKLWQFVVNHAKYEAAIQHRRLWLSNRGFELGQGGFFPLYRSSIVEVR